MASEATPRVNAKYLDSFTNQIVRVLGKVVSLRGETATIDADGSINVHLNRVSVPNTTGQGGRVEELGHVKVGRQDDLEYQETTRQYARRVKMD